MKRIAPVIALLALIGSAWAQSPPQKGTKEELTKLEAIYKKTKAEGAKAKASPKQVKAYVAATVAYGNCVMMSPTLPPREKYPKALNLYREALKLDPKNKVALDNKKLIEDIYKQMGRPVPKG